MIPRRAPEQTLTRKVDCMRRCLLNSSPSVQQQQQQQQQWQQQQVYGAAGNGSPIRCMMELQQKAMFSLLVSRRLNHKP